MGFVTAGLAQNEQQVPWGSDQRLEWKDFIAVPNPGNPFSANTSSGISYGWSFKRTGNEAPEFSYTVLAFFVPEKSWVRKGKEVAHLLQHEQLHFDITEIHARKLRKALQTFNAGNEKDIKGTLQKIYSRIESERKNMQELFDLETAHSQNVEAQLKWEQKIQQELEELKEFASE